MHLAPEDQAACLKRLIQYDYRLSVLQYDTIALRD
jgi:hypothetical protein